MFVFKVDDFNQSSPLPAGRPVNEGLHKISGGAMQFILFGVRQSVFLVFIMDCYYS